MGAMVKPWFDKTSRVVPGERLTIGALCLTSTVRERRYDIVCRMADEVHDRSLAVREDAWLRIAPVPPPLPVLFRPSSAILVPAGESVNLQLAVPVYVRIEASTGAPDPVTVIELPTAPEKRSWFGAADAGEAVSVFRPEVPVPGGDVAVVTTPVTVRNASATILSIERLVVRTLHVPICAIDGLLRTPSVSVTFKGSEQVSTVQYGNTRSIVARGGEVISPERVAATSAILRRSFVWLKDLAG